METRAINNEYADIAADLIATEPALADLACSQATIIYLSSDYARKSKEMVTHAVCEKVADKNKWAIPADFTITVYEPNIVHFTDDQVRILLFHELLHVGVDFKDDGTESYFVREHDYQDFKLIIDRFGTDWSK